jgi:hypothetical protein
MKYDFDNYNYFQNVILIEPGRNIDAMNLAIRTLKSALKRTDLRKIVEGPILERTASCGSCSICHGHWEWQFITKKI